MELNEQLTSLIVQVLGLLLTITFLLIYNVLLKIRERLKKEMFEQDLGQVYDFAETLILRVQKDNPKLLGELKHSMVKDFIKTLLPKNKLSEEQIDLVITQAYEALKESSKRFKKL